MRKNAPSNHVTVEEAVSLVRSYVAEAWHHRGQVGMWPVATALAVRCLAAERDASLAAHREVKHRQIILAQIVARKQAVARLRAELDNVIDHGAALDDEIDALRAQVATETAKRRLAEERLSNIVNLRRSA